MFAVLLDAVIQLRRRNSPGATEAEIWIRGEEGNDSPFSFDGVCGERRHTRKPQCRQKDQTVVERQPESRQPFHQIEQPRSARSREKAHDDESEKESQARPHAAAGKEREDRDGQ